MTGHIFLFLAAFVNGITDTLCFNFIQSRFRNLNPKWWNPNVSWQYVPLTLGFVRLDAYHVFKYLMILFLAISVKYYLPIFYNLWEIYYIFELMMIWGVGFEISRKIFKNN